MDEEQTPGPVRGQGRVWGHADCFPSWRDYLTDKADVICFGCGADGDDRAGWEDDGDGWLCPDCLANLLVWGEAWANEEEENP